MVVVCIAVLISGLLLMRVGILELKHPLARSVVYWAHVGCPIAGIWLYWLHRLVGPRIKWRVGLTYAAAVAALPTSLPEPAKHDMKLSECSEVVGTSENGGTGAS